MQGKHTEIELTRISNAGREMKKEKATKNFQAFNEWGVVGEIKRTSRISVATAIKLMAMNELTRWLVYTKDGCSPACFFWLL